MKPEQQRTEKRFDNDQNTFAQRSPTTCEFELLKEQALQTAGQEIFELYNMLQFKRKQFPPHLPGYTLN